MLYQFFFVLLHSHSIGDIMDLKAYFEPVSKEKIGYSAYENTQCLGSKIDTYWQEGSFPELKNVRLAIVGVCEGRRSVNNRGCELAPDAIREKLYPLAPPVKERGMVDLGNIAAGATPEDTYYALTEVLYKLMDSNITVVILGGGHDLAWAQYKAYEVLGRVINIASIDSRFDIEDAIDYHDSRSYLNRIVMEKPNYLFNFMALGYQTYFCGNDRVRLMDELQFDTIRLGELQKQMAKAEPFLRASDMVTVDVSAIRQSDAPGQGDPSPHGFYGEEICQMARFAGMSDKLSSIGFYELNPRFDDRGQTAHLLAHALWYFIEGFYNRMSDFPYRDKQNYLRFLVPINNGTTDIIFYKSQKTQRWWMEVPCDMDERRDRYARHLLIPCLHDDYLQATQGDVPELWMKTFQRVND